MMFNDSIQGERENTSKCAEFTLFLLLALNLIASLIPLNENDGIEYDRLLSSTYNSSHKPQSFIRYFRSGLTKIFD